MTTAASGACGGAAGVARVASAARGSTGGLVQRRFRSSLSGRNGLVALAPAARPALHLPWLGAYIWASESRELPMPSPLKTLPVVLLLPLLSLNSAALAQERRVPASPNEVRLSYAPIVQRVVPAVVNVYAGPMVANRNPLLDDPIFRRFFGVPGAPGGGEQMQRSLGSGVLVDAAGMVVTNNHVIEGATEVKVSLSDKREFEAEVVLKDTRSDLAVLRLKAPGERFPAIEFADSDALLVGDVVLAIGNPFAVGQTVTHGIVSAVARTPVGISDYQFFIQTDAAINPGNSGGALVDMSGKLVGINTAIFSRSGGSHGIGFAIPSTMVRAVIESARGGSRTVRRPWLGATLQGVDNEIAGSMGLPRPTGVLVSGVYDKGPAADAGLKRGDLILEVDGQPIDDPESFGYRFTLKGVEGKTGLTVLRGGQNVAVQVALMTPPETRPREPVR